MTSEKKPILAVVSGATASGKTAFSISLALALGTEIISADSRQIYRDMPVITAAPTSEERGLVPHHLAGILPVEQNISAGEYGRMARETMHDIFSRCGNIAVMCGGSALYVSAVTGSLHDVKEISPLSRQRICTLQASAGLEGLLAYLDILDPGARAIIDCRNPRRVAHAIELIEQNHRSLADIYSESKAGPSLPFKVVRFAIERSREELFDRINHRVDIMVQSGLIEEARRFYPLKDRGCNSLQGIGFDEMFRCLSGEWTFEFALERMKKNTRVFAKKQLLLLRSEPETVMLPANPATALATALEKIENLRKED